MPWLAPHAMATARAKPISNLSLYLFIVSLLETFPPVQRLVPLPLDQNRPSINPSILPEIVFGAIPRKS